MFMDVTHYSNETLAELHDAGLLFFAGGYGMPKPQVTTSSNGGMYPWNNPDWAYTERKKQKLCQLFVHVEE